MDQISIVKSFLEEDVRNGVIRDYNALKNKIEASLEGLKAAYDKVGLKVTVTFEDVMINVIEHFKEHFEFLDQTIILQTEDSKSDQVHFDKKRWIANQEFLRIEKKRSDGQIANLNYSLNVIMGHLVKHMSESEFYVKGMVYKEVQSGKTEHFNSLINLAFDNNYEIVIVLTGSQNDLRSQTQIRIDSDVIGQKSYEGDPEENLTTGIGNYWDDAVLTGCLTDKTSSGDINGEKTGMKISVDKNHPLIIVTKKNHDNLKSIIKLLRNNNVDNKAALIIDDESDLASIDTYYGKKTKKTNNKGKSPNDPDYVPSSINAHIRKLLKVFNRKSYVAYTATPFANLLVNRRIEHPEYGHDLYPRDFVLAISSDKNYVGPNQWFGVNGRARPLVKIQKVEPKGFADYLRTRKGLPTGLKEAIKAFVLSTSIRILREGEKEHNSMLIHTEMTNRVQELTYQAVRLEIKALNQQIATQNDNLYFELKSLFETDFIPNSLAVTGTPINLKWEEILEIIPEVLSKIEVMKINGESEDTLNYEDYKEKGLYVIAIGGNKLSRGITLDGLTISYYLRESKMQDTLTQMGRWYGYKDKYLDLCRLYTTQNLIVAFATTVKTIGKLMDDLTDMHNLQISPDDYELHMIEETDSLPPEIKALKKKKGNINLKLTAADKSRYGFRIARKSSWAGQLLQDTSFTRDVKINEENKEIIEKLLKGLTIPPKMSASNRVWLGIPMSHVIEVLEAFKTPSMRSLEMNNYIKAIQNETKNKELSKCNIVLISNRFDSSNEYLGEYKIARTERQKNSERHMRAVHVTDDEFIDLFVEKKIQTRTDKVSLRQKETAVLLIYPIKIDNSLEILSIAMSFPLTKALPADKTTYVVADGTYVG